MKVLGVDVGGTFTDAVLVTDDRDLVLAKAPTRPAAPTEGVLESVEKAAANVEMTADSLLADTDRFFHGTTIATNIVLERDGATVGLLTTKGHEDAQRIGRITTRHAGLSVGALKQYVEHEKSAPFARWEHTYGVEERIDREGDVIVELSDDEVRRGVERLIDQGVEVIAINFLWSFRNPRHEHAAAELIEREYDIPVFTSETIAPRIGEYERGATTCVAAFVADELSSYMETLDHELRQRGLSQPILVMQNNGGVIPASAVIENGSSVLVSGPAAGVTAAAEATIDAIKSTSSDEAGRQVICTDVGGTSFDVGLVVDGVPEKTPTLTIDRHTLYQQAIDIESIGNGGGSIAWLGSEGELNIGPESAGADPGPVCYDQGGLDPTVTDADLVLGFLDPDYFLGGEMVLDIDAARSTIEDQIARPLGLETDRAARGIYELMNAKMADLIRKITIENGYDPNEFTLFAYGGAGPAHATGYGRELGIRSVTVPLGNVASVFSAYGLTVADIQQVAEVSHPMVEPFEADRLEDIFANLQALLRASIGPRGETTLSFTRMIDMRYEGQSSELTITLPTTEPESLTDLDFRELFEHEYVRRYGESAKHPTSSVEIITQRVLGRIPMDPPVLARRELADTDPEAAKHRRVVWHEGSLETPIYFDDSLTFGHEIPGPAVIQLPSTTVPIPPESQGRIGEHGSITVDLGGGG